MTKMFTPVDVSTNLIHRKTSRMFDKSGRLLGNAKVSTVLTKGDSLL